MTTTHNSLVSGAALEEHLGAWAVVDCRFDLQRENWGLDQYLEAHVPSAVYASLSKDLSGRPDGSNGRHPLPSIDSMAETFGRLGIERSTQVVAYDQDAGMYASRLWWMLRYLGHQAVAVLDGGWARWTAEGRPTANGVERRSPARFVPQPRPEMLATAADVEAVLGQRSVVLVDARAPERFEGRSETIDRVAGHIPGGAFAAVADAGEVLIAGGGQVDGEERVVGTIGGDGDAPVGAAAGEIPAVSDLRRRADRAVEAAAGLEPHEARAGSGSGGLDHDIADVISAGERSAVADLVGAAGSAGEQFNL